MAVRTGREEVHALLQARGVDALNEYAVTAWRVQVAAANQRAMRGAKPFEPVLERARRSKVHPAATVDVASRVEPEQGLVAVSSHVAKCVRPKEPHGLGPEPRLERVVPDDTDIALTLLAIVAVG